MIRSWDGGRTWRHRWAEEFAEGFFGVGTRVVHPLFSNTSLEVGFPYRQQTLVVRSTLYPHSSPYPIRLALILSTTSDLSFRLAISYSMGLMLWYIGGVSEGYAGGFGFLEEGVSVWMPWFVRKWWRCCKGSSDTFSEAPYSSLVGWHLGNADGMLWRRRDGRKPMPMARPMGENKRKYDGWYIVFLSSALLLSLSCFVVTLHQRPL